MGDIISGVIGGVGSLAGGKKARQAANQGFNYDKNTLGPGYTAPGATANENVGALLNGGPNSAASRAAYGNYLSSTGYNFQLKQGTSAITGSSAARGLLNSGATAKALTEYGQNLASTSFNNYLTQEGSVADRGLQAGVATGQAGTKGGDTAANNTGIPGLTGSLQGAVGGPTISNWLAGI